MAKPDVKSLIDSIIDSTDNSYKNSKGPVFDKDTVGATVTRNNFHPQTFDKGKFKEKLSLYVLHDIISAMMHDDTEDLNGMIDQSIMRHIRNNYDGTCFGYLCSARDRLKSPLLADVIQELEDETEVINDTLERTKDDETLNGDIDINDVLKDVTNYEEFREKLKKQVSDKVVDDVSNVITTRNDAPVFDDLDAELTKKDADQVGEDITEESVIFKLCGAIVTEYAIAKNPITTEEGLNMAIVEYCLNEMDYLFKARPKMSMYDRHKI